MKVGPGVWLIHSRAGQSLLVEGPPLTLIDTGAAGSLGRLRRAFSRGGHRLEDLQQLIVTHPHHDHIGEAAALKALSGASVLIHAKDAAAASGEEQPSTDTPRGSGARLLMKLFAKPFAPVPVDGFLEDETTIDPGIRVIATPGHTPGHCSLIIEKTGLLHVGDAMFNITGLRPPPRAFNFDELEVYRSIQRLAALSFRRTTFGHGPPIFRHARTRLEKAARRYRMC
ncbi:MAG: MBL fold metallo-hydrolase [Actinomycetota bacterium]